MIAQGLYFSDAKDLREIPPVGWVKIGDFRQIAGYISKTVQDRRVVSIKVEQEVVCALSNGDIAVDLECPLTTPNHPFSISTFRTAIHSFVTGEPIETSYLVNWLTIARPTLPKKIFPERGVVRVK